MLRKTITFILLTFISLAFAHDLWLEKERNTYKLLYGHKYPHKGENSISPKILKYNPENVKSILCITENGEKREINFQKKYPVKFNNTECALIYVIYSSGYWSKTPYGEFNKPKNQTEMVIDSWLSYEIVKRINKWNKNLEKSFINTLEIIPTNNPLKLEIGDKLRLKILFNGKPLENIPVYYNGKFRGTTDENGRINIRIKKYGFQMIEATFKQKVNSQKADKIVYTTILNFELEK